MNLLLPVVAVVQNDEVEQAVEAEAADPIVHPVLLTVVEVAVADHPDQPLLLSPVEIAEENLSVFEISSG